MSVLSHPGDDVDSVAAIARFTVAEHSLRLGVIVPVFNNGEHLRTSSFPSLIRSSGFRQMHVLLVDDGSTYPQTLDAIGELATAYPNVTAFFHATGGSGSASRPRNTGLDLAFTEYLTYLDPDDEFLGRGPWPLIDALEEHPAVPLAIGNQQRIYSDRIDDVDNLQHYTHDSLDNGCYRAGPDAVVKAKFRPSNLSSLALRTQWLKSSGIRQVPQAAGQDSLFFLQIFAAADAFVTASDQIYAYHAETPGSMVNSITARFFSQCKRRMEAQAQWLKAEGLFDSYVQTGFEQAVVWYLHRYRRTPKEQRAEAAGILREMAELFVDPATHRWRYPETMAFFRRPGVPSAEGMKPVATQARRAIKKTLGQVRSTARRSVQPRWNKNS